jgi:hypothetical protein
MARSLHRSAATTSPWRVEAGEYTGVRLGDFVWSHPDLAARDHQEDIAELVHRPREGSDQELAFG